MPSRRPIPSQMARQTASAKFKYREISTPVGKELPPSHWRHNRRATISCGPFSRGSFQSDISKSANFAARAWQLPIKVPFQSLWVCPPTPHPPPPNLWEQLSWICSALSSEKGKLIFGFLKRWLEIRVSQETWPSRPILEPGHKSAK